MKEYGRSVLDRVMMLSSSTSYVGEGGHDLPICYHSTMPPHGSTFGPFISLQMLDSDD